MAAQPLTPIDAARHARRLMLRAIALMRSTDDPDLTCIAYGLEDMAERVSRVGQPPLCCAGKPQIPRLHP